MKLTIFIALILFTNFIHAFEVAYVTKSNGMIPVCDRSYLELKNLPPVLDQGSKGLCYAHSSLLLLDYLRCSKTSSPTSCYQDKGSVLHLARFDQAMGQEIEIGGIPGNVLSNFRYHKSKLAKEECAPYSKWFELDDLRREELNKLNLPSKLEGDRDYFMYLSSRLEGNVSYEDKTCFADEILGTGIKLNTEEIMNILNKSKEMSWKELRYKILVPESCLKNTISYPDYKIITYPRGKQKRDFKGIRDHVYRSLMKGYPVEASFCAEKDSDGICGYHSSTIVGQRQICNQQDCRLQFRLQNSYGKSWQEYNDNGWIDAENLSSLIADHSMTLNTILPDHESLDMALATPLYSNSPVSRNSNQVSLSNKGKEDLFGNESCWDISSGSYTQVQPERNPINSVPTPLKPTEPGKKVIYVCKGEGKTVFSDSPQPGMECKVR